MRADSAFLRRVVALGILALVLMAAWVGPVAAYRELLGAEAEQIEQKSAVLQRYHGLVESPAPASASAADEAGAGLLLPDLPEAQAVALLQETVKSAAAAAQVQVQGLQVLRADSEAGAQRIGVRVRATGDAAGLGRLLYGIEAARPLLYPDNLQVQSHMTAPGTPPAPLDFQLDISGFKAGAPS